jgi:dCMP deaminase
MEMAMVFAKRSACCHYHVGAVLAKNKRFLNGGYNGPVSGDVHCSDPHIGCAKVKDGVKLPHGSGRCRGAHAEINSITNAANLGVIVEGATLYVSYRPCLECTKHIINAGIKKVIYVKDYDGDEAAVELMNRMGIALVKFDTISNMKFE